MLFGIELQLPLTGELAQLIAIANQQPAIADHQRRLGERPKIFGQLRGEPIDQRINPRQRNACGEQLTQQPRDMHFAVREVIEPMHLTLRDEVAAPSPPPHRRERHARQLREHGGGEERGGRRGGEHPRECHARRGGCQRGASVLVLKLPQLTLGAHENGLHRARA